MLLLSRFVIRGHSMEPTLPHGTTVFASGIPYLFSSPKIGDVAAFVYGKKIFIKRIRNIKGNMCVFSGDNKQDSLDSRVIGALSRRQIVGKVLFRVGR